MIDGVTGQVLQRVVEKQCEGPVHLAVTENVIVYHYFDSSNQRMLVFDVFDMC